MTEIEETIVQTPKYLVSDAIWRIDRNEITMARVALVKAVEALETHPHSDRGRETVSNGVPWAGDDERWDQVAEAWQAHANEHVDESGRIDVSEVDTCVCIALHRAFILSALTGAGK